MLFGEAEEEGKMKRLGKILRSLVFPHWLIALLVIPTGFGMLMYSFLIVPEDDVIAYLSYAWSAYALTILCTSIPRIIRFGKRFRGENPFAQRYFSDTQYRIKWSLYGSLTVNMLYAVLQLGSGIYYHSAWFYTLSGYYVILAVMRYFLLKETRHRELGKNLFREYLHYRFCGILLLLLNLALGVMAFYIVSQSRGFEHNPIITIAMAAYTFFAITMAVINFVKYRKKGSPVMEAVKAISLAAALVSMLSLETAMISAFGEDNGPMFRKIMTASTGAAVFVLILAMAVFMIWHSTKEIQKIKRQQINADETED